MVLVCYTEFAEVCMKLSAKHTRLIILHEVILHGYSNSVLEMSSPYCSC